MAYITGNQSLRQNVVKLEGVYSGYSLNICSECGEITNELRRFNKEYFCVDCFENKYDDLVFAEFIKNIRARRVRQNKKKDGTI
ncbi:MAG: hypothetical protein K9W44_16245 [Candidatus Lokiarchaeota archaeon]|nr:hypothetical protein [Candidatus Harpocratesius repetitus]